MKISHISHNPEAIPVVAKWIIEEWGDSDDPDAVRKEMANLKYKSPAGKIPSLFVACKNENYVGTASVIENDMVTRNDLGPWMAGIYVLPRFRNTGIGSELVRTMIEEARSLQIKRLYLWTVKSVNFYGRLGWKFYGTTEYLNKTMTIMNFHF